MKLGKLMSALIAALLVGLILGEARQVQASDLIFAPRIGRRIARLQARADLRFARANVLQARAHARQPVFIKQRAIVQQPVVIRQNRVFQPVGFQVAQQPVIYRQPVQFSQQRLFIGSSGCR